LFVWFHTLSGIARTFMMRESEAIKYRKAQKDSDFIKSKPSKQAFRIRMGICSFVGLRNKKAGRMPEKMLEFDGLDFMKECVSNT